VLKIKKYVDEMFTIFPFESDFYSKYGYKVHYVGNPTVEELAWRPNQDQTLREFTKKNHLTDKPIIALLAGSRSDEIKRILPVMKKASERFGGYQFVIAGVPSQSSEIYIKALEGSEIPVVYSQTYELLQQSIAALVASGTATLETAILNVPQVVCYRIEAGWLGGLIKRLIVKVPFISLVNLITGREVVKELFQETCTPKSVGDELERILKDGKYRENMLKGYEEMLGKLGRPGCSERAANEMINILRKGD
jgi:lipid-A-disaccharide synthase